MIELFNNTFLLCVIGQYVTYKICNFIYIKERIKLTKLIEVNDRLTDIKWIEMSRSFKRFYEEK